MRSIIERRNIYEGFNYIVKLFEDGHRCGYVNIPENHKYFNKEYDDIPIECHGGLTFSKLVLPDNNDFDFNPGFWIGFDCAHSNDQFDVKTANTVWPDNLYANFFKLNINFFGTVKTIEYVENECKNIIKQLNGDI